MSVKPAIVLVPGAWHKVSQYAPLSTRLEQAGYKVHGVDYPSIGPNPKNETFEPDVKEIAGAIESLADQEHDVMVVVHSAAGILAGEAAKGLSKSARRKEGKRGGISHMVYIAAFAAPEGKSLWEAANGPQEWEVVEGLIIKCSKPKELFYNECTPEQADENAAQLELIAKGAFTSKTTYAPWKEIPCTYLLCENDKAIPPEAQEAMSSQPGNKFDVVRCKADHSPFLCMPDFTAKVVRRAAGETVDV